MKTITALLAVGALALSACGSSSNNSSSSSPASASSSSSGGGAYGSASANTTASSSAGGSGTVKVQMVDDAFKPTTITGKPGATVTVALTNTGANKHNFKIDGQPKADADVDPGKSATATVKIPKSGSVQFYCEYHKGLGMVGTVKPA
jgi:plastocyanin